MESDACAWDPISMCDELKSIATVEHLDHSVGNFVLLRTAILVIRWFRGVIYILEVVVHHYRSDGGGRCHIRRWSAVLRMWEQAGGAALAYAWCYYHYTVLMPDLISVLLGVLISTILYLFFLLGLSMTKCPLNMI